MYYPRCLTLLVALYLICKQSWSYRIIEYSYIDGSGDGEGNENDNEEDSLEDIRKLNPGVVILKKKQDDNFTLVVPDSDHSKEAHKVGFKFL